MATRRVSEKKTNENSSKRRPATTPQARENQMIAKAIDLAERQLEDGTASAQVISHYLKLGSSREKLEQERLARENEFLEAKKEAMASAQRVEAMYETALMAMRAYSGHGAPLEQDGEFDD